MNKEMKLELVTTMPVSINKLYINEARYNPKTKQYMPTGKRILSKDGRKVKNKIQAEARVQMAKQDDWDYEWTKEGYCYLDTEIVFARRGSDDNNIYKLLCDALEKICYDNDSRILVRTQKIMYNSKNPRVCVTIQPVEFVGVFDSQEQADELVAEYTNDKGKYIKGTTTIIKDLLKGTEREEYDPITNSLNV